MADETRRWTLQDVVDLEAVIASPGKVPAAANHAAVDAARGLEGVAARRAGLRCWLDGARRAGAAGSPSAGTRFSRALSLVAVLAGLLAAAAGISAVIGMLDPARGGMNVAVFLAVIIGGQWLLLVFALLAWLFRRRAGEGFSGVQALAGKAARRMAGDDAGGWWQPLMESASRNALLWRLARLAQGAGISFNLGVIAGLAGLVLLRNVGFFWETTTEVAMRETLDGIVRTLSFPWASGWRDAVPDADTIAASRWIPGQTVALAPGPAAWWRFLLMATLVWGLLPRLFLWLLAWAATRRALARLDFQARHHRQVWRDIAGAQRAELDEKPLDGVLVLDVGGSGVDREALRPFLLRRLRVNPAAWQPVAVLDPGAEDKAARALAIAPAGVVLFAEGWALSPPRMTALLSQVRQAAGVLAPVKFLVANLTAEGLPQPPTAGEKHEWERFVDGLRDASAEVVFFEDPA